MKSPIQTLPTKRKRKQQLFLANLSSATGLFKGWLSGKGGKKRVCFFVVVAVVVLHEKFTIVHYLEVQKKKELEFV